MSLPSTLSNSSNKPTADPFVHYAVKVVNTAEHILLVNMHVKVPAQTAIKVQLPAWIPGSYMIRDFARNLHQLSSLNENLTIIRLDKQSWSLTHRDGSSISEFELSYHVYAFDLSVRSAYIDDQYAFFNGTSVYLSIANFESIVHKVELDGSIYASATQAAGEPKYGLASSLLLRDSATLPAVPREINEGQSKRIFLCDDYFELIDHPVLLGNFNQHSFMVDNYRFHLVFTGEHALDFARLEQDLSPIIKHHLAIFGELPCSEYWFITLVCEQGFGGLEHIASTVLQYNRFDLPLINLSANAVDNKVVQNDTSKLSQKSEKPKIEKNYQQFLSLCSHELFHTWHVKRIKPQVMHQPDLSREVYTEQMWIYEGFTSLYDDLSLARAGVISPQDYVQILNENITRLLKNPGRHKQSVAESSFEAWSKFYKQDAGSINHIVSYYNKGAVVALCLDILLRQQSDNAVCLDHVMQKLWADYGKPEKGTPDNVITLLCAKHFDLDISSFIHMATQTTMDLPLPTLLQSIGLSLNLRPSHSMQDKGGPTSKHLPTVDVGAGLVSQDKFLRVTNVQSTRASSLAGLQVNDLIVSLDNWQCDEQGFYTILMQHEIGESLPLHVLRDGRLLELSFTLYAAINDTSDITISNETMFKQWLGLA